jgi:hypothetical protein
MQALLEAKYGITASHIQLVNLSYATSINGSLAGDSLSFAEARTSLTPNKWGRKLPAARSTVANS